MGCPVRTSETDRPVRSGESCGTFSRKTRYHRPLEKRSGRQVLHLSPSEEVHDLIPYIERPAICGIGSDRLQLVLDDSGHTSDSQNRFSRRHGDTETRRTGKCLVSCLLLPLLVLVLESPRGHNLGPPPFWMHARACGNRRFRITASGCQRTSEAQCAEFRPSGTTDRKSSTRLRLQVPPTRGKLDGR